MVRSARHRYSDPIAALVPVEVTLITSPKMPFKMPLHTAAQSSGVLRASHPMFYTNDSQPFVILCDGLRCRCKVGEC